MEESYWRRRFLRISEEQKMMDILFLLHTMKKQGIKMKQN